MRILTIRIQNIHDIRVNGGAATKTFERLVVQIDCTRLFLSFVRLLLILPRPRRQHLIYLLLLKKQPTVAIHQRDGVLVAVAVVEMQVGHVVSDAEEEIFVGEGEVSVITEVA